jgi:hypothetical protein
MPISQEDAQNLYKSGNISQDTFNSIAPQPELQNTQDLKITDPNAALNIPKGQPVLASNSFIPNPLDTIVDIGKAANDSTVTNQRQGYNLNIFENPTATNQEAKVQKNLPEAEKALSDIGQKTEDIMAPVTKEAQANVEEQNHRNQVFAENAKFMLTRAENSQNLAMNKLESIYQNASIDPENYVKNLGVSGKVATGIGLVLSGMGSGLTGQPNMAMQVLQNNINRDIDAQKQNIENQFKVAAQQLNVSNAMLNTAQVKSAITNIAAGMVYKGAAAVTEASSNNVKSQTAKQTSVLLKNQLNQQAGQYFLNVDALHKGTITADQQEMNKLITGALSNYGKFGQFSTPDLYDVNKTGYKNLNRPVSKPQPIKQPIQQPQATQPKQEKGFMDSMSELLGSATGMKQPTSMGE